MIGTSPAVRVLRALSRFDIATGGDLLEVLGGHGSANMQCISRAIRRAIARGHAERYGLSYRITDAGKAWLAAATTNPQPVRFL